MTLAAPPTRPRDPAYSRPREPKSLDVAPQDRASGLVVALLVALGSVVLIMFALWLSSGIRFHMPAKVSLATPDGRDAGGSPGAEQPLEEVHADSENTLQEVPIEQTLRTVTAAVAAQSTALEALGGGTGGVGIGDGPSVGDRRGPGPPGKPAAKLPDWEVHFNASTLELYAAQLDFCGIELGAVGGGKQTVDYAARLSQPEPATRSAAGADEQRRYLVWRKGPLAAADRSLLAKAKIDATGRIILQFLPAEVEARMAQLELEHARGRPRNEIRRTVFGVTGSAGRYEFVVIEQEYR